MRRPRLHLDQLMLIPITLIGMLLVVVYGGMVWALDRLVKDVIRHYRTTESNDSVN